MGHVFFLAGYYDYRLVALSIFISILAAFAALDLAERVTTAQGGSRVAWLYGGAVAMGIGIWAMHYVGMVAFHLPIPVLYDWPTVLLSLLIAVAASAVALYVVSRPSMGIGRTVLGSLFMGGGIATMHYVGMAAMRLRAMCMLGTGLVLLSIVLAVAISFVALQLAFARRSDRSNWSQRKIVSGLLMGAAIPTMHYVGMAAENFVPQPGFSAGVAHAITITAFGLSVIVVATVIILSHVYWISTIDRRFAHQEGQLVERGVQLKAIFDSLMEGIVVLDSTGKVVEVNAAANRILGLPDEANSLTSAAAALDVCTIDGVLLTPEQWPGARAMRGEFVKNLELELHSSHTGKDSVVEITTSPLLNSEGEVIQTIMTSRDITERKRAERAAAHLVAIVQSSQDAIIGKDLSSIVTSWNRGAELMFGYAASEMIGHSIIRLLPPGFEDEETVIIERIHRGESVEQMETTRIRKDGQQIQVSLMISPIRGVNNRIIGCSKIARDITERKLLERQLRQSQKMEAIGQLTGGIAHDFNNLLAILIGNLSLLERMLEGNPEAMKRLKPAQKAAARGADITRRLLALASKEDLNPASVRIEDAVREVIELAGRALGPEIKIQTSFADTVPPVFVDAAGLESALLNLAVNARDAMPKGGTLAFSAKLTNLDESFPPVQTGELQPGTYAHISVSDTGHGMSKQTVERAMEPFFTTKARNKGTGLGLAMVYGFARQSGGTARIYSEQGYGTTVSLYLPLAGETAPKAPELPIPRQRTETGGTVLVVDDETDLLEIAQAYLASLGYSVLRADNPASALNALVQHKGIDLMITDIIMPGGMNGVELAEKARKLNPNLMVIYCSGFPADALVERSGTMVDGPMLRKPYQRSEFAAIIQRTLDLRIPAPQIPEPLPTDQPRQDLSTHEEHPVS
jgi:PAS domain S-box-containing protein